MHELSIARHLLGLIRRHTPAGAVVSRVRVEAGPLRAIDPDALQWAWRASIPDTDCRAATLELKLLPWRWRCPACEHQWDSRDYPSRCQCGCEQAALRGGDELTVISLDVDETASATTDVAEGPSQSRVKQAWP